MGRFNNGRDAAFPENLFGMPEDEVTLGYFGGPNALNVWSTDEWARFNRNYKIPIWVAGMDGIGEGHDARNLLESGLNVPSGKVVMVDMEGRKDRTYLQHFGGILQVAGYKVWDYGSLNHIFQDPPLNGYAVADPTGIMHMYPHTSVRMTQWAFGQQYDNDIVRHWLISEDEFWL